MKKALLFIYLVLSIAVFGFMSVMCYFIFKAPFTERDFKKLFTDGEGIPILFVIFSSLTIVYLIKFLTFNSTKLNNESLDEYLAPKKTFIFKRNRFLDLSAIIYSIKLLFANGLFIFLWITETPPEDARFRVILMFAGLLAYFFLSIYFYYCLLQSSKTSHKE